MKTRSIPFAPPIALLALLLAGPGPTRAGGPAQEATDPYTRVQQAKAALDAGQHQKVLEIVDGLLAEYPDSPSSHLLRGMALDELDRLDEAAESYEAALRSAPDEPQILARYGMHHLRREAWDDAVRYLERSLSAADDPVTLFYLAQAYFQTENKRGALETIERCARLVPDNPTVQLKLGEYRAHAGKHSPALEALRRAQELNPEEPGLDLALGNVLLRLLEVEAAREALVRAERKEPENPAVLASLAEACSKARDHAAALGYYRKLLELGHDDPQYHLGLGAALLGLEQHQEAIRELNKAVEANPRLEEAHFHLARAYQVIGQTDESRRELGIFRALKASPFSPLDDRTEFERGLWREAGDLVKAGKEEEALELLSGGNAPGLEPEFLVGALYYWQGRLEEAERLLTRAREISPRIPNLRTYLGLTYLEQGRLEEAEGLLAAELEENPREPLVLMAVGQLHYEKGEWAEAARQLESSKIVDSRILLMRCEAQLRLGETDQARETVLLIRTLAGGDATTLAALERLLERYGLEPDDEPETAVDRVPPPARSVGHAP
jgi:tetratricopeptide (TPR) repeat protein